jgi:hypothetical protein
MIQPVGLLPTMRSGLVNWITSSPGCRFSGRELNCGGKPRYTVEEKVRLSVCMGLASAGLARGGASADARDRHRAIMIRIATVLLFMFPPLFRFALAEVR